MWSALAPGETTAAAHFMARVDAPRGVYLRSQPAGAKDGPLLPFDTRVAVERTTERGWFYVVSLGDSKQGSAPPGVGFLEGYHVASHPPEPTAHLYMVAPGDRLASIAEKFYGHGFAWGHDARLYVQAIYHANKDRDAVFRQNPGGGRTEITVDRRALDTSDRDKALALWREARVVAGQALWMPGESFVRALKASGAIHHASLSRAMWDASASAMHAVADAAAYAGGFAVGVLEGAWGALEDLFMGLTELLHGVWGVTRALFGDLSALRAFADKLVALWQHRDDVLASIAIDFLARWEAEDPWDRGNFQGEVLGYAMMLAFITLVTLGQGAVIAGAGRFGTFIRLLQLADAAGDITTYAGMLFRTVKLPENMIQRASSVLGRKASALEVAADDAAHAGKAGRRADKPAGAADAAGAAGGASPAHPHRHGGPYADPRETPELPRRPLERRELAPTRRLKPRKSWKDAARALKKTGKPVALGRTLKAAEEGHEILQRLACGDASALRKLGIDDFPADLDPMGREWALVQARDGFVVYAGKYGEVELPADVRVLAHNHPGPIPSAELGDKKPTIDLPVPDRAPGLTYDEIVRDPVMALRSGIAPSPQDIHAISDGTSHVIYTRYVHRGVGHIANPAAGETGSRVALHLSDTRVVRWNPRSKEYWYEVSVHVKDSAGASLWRGKMYAHWYAQSAILGEMHLVRPPHLDRPPALGWSEP